MAVLVDLRVWTLSIPRGHDGANRRAKYNAQRDSNADLARDSAD
jgi:hypothetical protein